MGDRTEYEEQRTERQSLEELVFIFLIIMSQPPMQIPRQFRWNRRHLQSASQSSGSGIIATALIQLPITAQHSTIPSPVSSSCRAAFQFFTLAPLPLPPATTKPELLLSTPPYSAFFAEEFSFSLRIGFRFLLTNSIWRHG
jgi:hypothetical protein